MCKPVTRRRASTLSRCFWGWLDARPKEEWSAHLRGDIAQGYERMMQEAEARVIAYLFKLKRSPGVGKLIAELVAGSDKTGRWALAGRGQQLASARLAQGAAGGSVAAQDRHQADPIETRSQIFFYRKPNNPIDLPSIPATPPPPACYLPIGRAALPAARAASFGRAHLIQAGGPIPMAVLKSKRRPTTPRQRLASRLNGARSLGPGTATGKFTSTLNSFQHGAHSQIVTILPEGTQRFDPQDHVDLELVEQMASSSWRRRRHSAILNAMWNDEIARLTQEPTNDKRTGLELAAKAYENLALTRASLRALEVAENSEILKFNRASKALRDLYDWRTKQEIQNEPRKGLKLIP